MLNLHSYTDEGGHEDEPNRLYLGLAGFVAPAGNWDVFSAEWLDVLDKAGLKEPFTMKHFAHFKGQFANWNESSRQTLMARLIEIIRATNATPIGAVISLSDYQTLTASQQAALREPFYVVFQFCTRIAAIEATIEPPEETVAMTYAYNSEYGVTFAGKAEQLWHKIKSKFQHGSRMRSYACGTPLELPQLQAADLLAYELTRDFESIRKRPNLGMRWPLKQILRMCKIPKPQIMFFDRKELFRVIRGNSCNAKFSDQTGIEEIDDTQVATAQDFMAKWLTERGEYVNEWPQ
ncbi:MAG: hypothetical protein WA672_06565 [Candidatus Angelobacter sp.]